VYCLVQFSSVQLLIFLLSIFFTDCKFINQLINFQIITAVINIVSQNFEKRCRSLKFKVQSLKADFQILEAGALKPVVSGLPVHGTLHLPAGRRGVKYVVF